MNPLTRHNRGFMDLRNPYRQAALFSNSTSLRYIATLDERVREMHRSWHGTVRQVDDPFWNSHYPPNGWRCRCSVVQLSKRDAKRYGWKQSPPPSIQTKPWHNARTGEMIQVPQGISPGFAYNVGKARMRAFTPPPLGGVPPTVPPYGGLPPLPPARAFQGSKLPADLSQAEYARRFLGEFGIKPGQSKV